MSVERSDSVTAPLLAGGQDLGVTTPQQVDRLRDRLAVGVFVLVLTIPMLALLAGYRPQNLENRTLAKAPPLVMERLLDAKFYSAIDTFLTENLPVRSDAALARGWLYISVLGASTNPLVTIGRDGWLYLSQDFEPVCTSDATTLLGVIDRSKAAFAAKGSDFMLTVAPDKRTMFPEHAPDPRATPCTEDLRDTLQTGFAARPGSTTDLWSVLFEAKTNGHGNLYPPLNSHWTRDGALVAIQALVEAVEPRAWDPEDVSVQGQVSMQGELSRLLGLPTTDLVPRAIVRRENVVSQSVIENTAVRTTPWFTSSGPDAVVPGRTLFVTDSFLWDQIHLVAPWFEESVWLNFDDLKDRPGVVESFPRIDRVIVETVERSAYERPMGKLMKALSDRLNPPGL